MCAEEYGHFFKYMPDSVVQRSARYLSVVISRITFENSSLLQTIVVVRLTVRINSRVEHNLQIQQQHHRHPPRVEVVVVLEVQLEKTRKVQRDRKERRVERSKKVRSISICLV